MYRKPKSEVTPPLTAAEIDELIALMPRRWLVFRMVFVANHGSTRAPAAARAGRFTTWCSAVGALTS